MTLVPLRDLLPDEYVERIREVARAHWNGDISTKAARRAMADAYALHFERGTGQPTRVAD